MTETQREALRQEIAARLAAKLDELDALTHRPGEAPLRSAVAKQANERLREMDERP